MTNRQRAENTASTWQSRIVDTGVENPDQLLAHPDNWRIHPKHQQEALAAVLAQVGWVQQVIVNRRTGRIVDGHLRVSLALKNGEAEVPVVYIDIDEAEERLILSTFDSISALAGTDEEKRAELAAAVAQDFGDLAEQLTTAGAMPDAAGAATSGGSLLSLVDVTIADPRTKVEDGDVWKVGRHKLVCVDPITEWKKFVELLTPGALLCCYPGPLLALTEAATTKTLLMVQPDPYAAGHVIDRFIDVHGDAEVVRLR